MTKKLLGLKFKKQPHNNNIYYRKYIVLYYSRSLVVRKKNKTKYFLYSNLTFNLLLKLYYKEIHNLQHNIDTLLIIVMPPSQSKEAGIRTLVALDDQGGESY